MNILIIGGQFHNKGAYLMVMTVMKEIRKRLNGVTIVFSNYLPLPEPLLADDVKLLKRPIVHVGYSKKKFKIYFEFGFLINHLKSFTKGDIKFSEIDVIIDIAGFAYGDLWGISPIENLNYLLKKAKKHQIKYITLPQAFGSFEKQGIKYEMLKVVKSADLIYARDKVSKMYLDKLSDTKSNKVKLAPDITLTMNNEDIQTNIDPKYCCIVPNERMLDKGDASWKENYIPLLKKMADVLVKENIQIKILVHDSTSGDMVLAKKLLELISAEYCSLIQIDDPIEIKHLIAGSLFLVGSRFHSIASAFSSNVPCLGIGWSHKYKMLFEDYRMEDYVYDKPNELEMLRSLQDLIQFDENLSLRNVIRNANSVIKDKNDLMWQEVSSLILS
ncbi:polysaccharide pyruvyl transferase family protein [Chondrinema litorale]|uniref:polysaccharide pyruvyl transferase family protein n=1 Tax=Chondrinema litorale TaxID=2994555 RepID=UPI002543A393|nr:polysaccharide pyruvyl transferase family protein [Chondrinema litorale]UZR94362.1 polysaccharide pyruvyl transferase family protein [Chondrinema litorale]